MIEMLIQGYKVIIDLEDVETICNYNWVIKKRGNTHYALSRKYSKNPKKELPPILMHRLLLNTPKGKVTDHKNRNGLDNRKTNLRVSSYAENVANADFKTSKTGFKGVCYLKRDKKYLAYSSTRSDGKRVQHRLGRFQTAIEAAKVYDKFVLKKFGEFALTNKMLGRYG